MRRGFLAAGLATLAVALVHAQADTWRHWQFVAPVTVPAGTPATLAGFVMTPDLVSRAQTDWADLRVIDDAGREVPFVIRERHGERHARRGEADGHHDGIAGKRLPAAVVDGAVGERDPQDREDAQRLHRDRKPAHAEDRARPDRRGKQQVQVAALEDRDHGEAERGGRDEEDDEPRRDPRRHERRARHEARPQAHAEEGAEVRRAPEEHEQHREEPERLVAAAPPAQAQLVRQQPAPSRRATRPSHAAFPRA